eukprot:10686782-Lingulodinium_polyedra.AAC.1
MGSIEQRARQVSEGEAGCSLACEKGGKDAGCEICSEDGEPQDSKVFSMFFANITCWGPKARKYLEDPGEGLQGCQAVGL